MEEADGTLSYLSKISDFGLALRAMPLATGRGWGTVWTPPRGTPLYMAPEMFVERDVRGCVQVGRSLPCPHTSQFTIRVSWAFPRHSLNM